MGGHKRENLLGEKVGSIDRRQKNKLKTDNPKLIKQYNSWVHKWFTEKSLYEKQAIIQKQAEIKGWTNKLERQYNKIHKQSYAIRKLAENKLWRGGSSTTPYSPAYKEIEQTIKYWKNRLNQHQGQKVNTKGLYRRSKKYNIQYKKLTSTEISQELDKAYTRLKAFKPNSSEERRKFLWRLAEEKEKDDNKKTKKQYLHQLMRIEDQRIQAKSIKIMRQKFGIPPTYRAEIETPQGTVEVSNRIDLEQAIVKENI